MSLYSLKAAIHGYFLDTFGGFMATNFADINMVDLAARRTRAEIEHRFFLAFAILFPVVTILGFVPNYVFTLPYQPPRMTPVVAVHSASMTAWIILFTVQAVLISTKRIRVHMTLGMLSIALAIVMVVSGLLTGYYATAAGRGFPGFTPEEFFAVPAGDMITFAALFAAAIYYRKRSAEHKRLMLVVMLNFLAPSIARMPFPFIPDLGAIWLFGVPSVLGLVLIAADTYITGKLNRVFAAGLAFMIASGPIRIAICRTETWTEFVRSII